jgi:phosphoglycerol transferase MdoB-like AlkP superfamily enzyme
VSARVAGKDLNVVLVSVESLSAEFLGRFGNSQNLTPELDRLAASGLEFTCLYATGTRTVRGLEALSIGTPPTPGQSIVRRPDNNSLENLGEELGENGWTPYWIYGGYGFFDNMNAYFGSNGYNVVDRTDLEAAGLTPHAENIWGIADEDLFSLTIATLDRAHAEGQRFFAHVMTTSNHRPYTFPEDRIDLPQGKREGAVKYTDWAIGDFIRRSASKPWFDNTLFIITADHTSKAAGKTDLPLDRYHIPMIWYAPKIIEPSRMDRLMSQIDIGPSLMGWLGMSYSSRFFGYDIFALEEGRERAFISTYQKLGYLSAGRLVILDVNRAPEVADGLPVAAGSGPLKSDDDLIADAIAWYQSASHYFKHGDLREDEKEGAS